MGGTVVSAQLLDYPLSQDKETQKVTLFSRKGDNLFIAQSGLLSRQAAPNHTSLYTSSRMNYRLSEGADELRIPLTWVDDSGIRVSKSFIFRRGSYEIRVHHTLSNESPSAWTGSRYEQLQRARDLEEESGSFTNPGRYSFNGIGFYSPDEKFEKVDFDDVADELVDCGQEPEKRF